IPNACLQVVAQAEVQRQTGGRLPLVGHVNGVAVIPHLPLEVRKRCLELCGAFQIREAEVRIGGIEVLVLTEGPGPEDVAGGPFVSREVLDAAAKFPAMLPSGDRQGLLRFRKSGPSARSRYARWQALVRSRREARKPED